jgi:hypothetical protein
MAGEHLVALPLMSAVISGAFATSVLLQFLHRRKLHQLAWSLGLVLFAFTSFLQGLSEAWGWTVEMYKVYYPSTALLVGLLGLGTVFLLGRKYGLWYAYALIPLAIALYTLAATALVEPPTEVGVRAGGSGMPPYVRSLGLAFTIPGSIALIGGAGYSWWRTRRSYNLLIAVGAAIVAAGGSLARLGMVELLYATNLIGIAVMFVGFLRSQEVGVKAVEPVASVG